MLQALNHAHAQGEDGEGASQVEHHGGGGLQPEGAWGEDGPERHTSELGHRESYTNYLQGLPVVYSVVLSIYFESATE